MVVGVEKCWNENNIGDQCTWNTPCMVCLTQLAACTHEDIFKNGLLVWQCEFCNIKGLNADEVLKI